MSHQVVDNALRLAVQPLVRVGHGATEKTNSKRKMTAAIIEDNQKAEEVYEFLQEDDDFEEFEIGAVDEDFTAAGQADVEMQTLSLNKRDSVSNFMEKDRQLQWKADWDDEEADEDFEATLREQLRM